MTKQEILDFMNRNPVCHLATVQDGKPHVRGMLMYRADGQGVIFHTGRMKDVCAQMLANPCVEMCFNNHEEKRQIRVSGVARLVEDLELKKEIVANRPFMQPWVQQSGYDFLAVFRIEQCVATWWTFEGNFEPKQFVALT